MIERSSSIAFNPTFSAFFYTYILFRRKSVSLLSQWRIFPGGRERERAILIARRGKELELEEEYCSVDGGDVETDLTVLDWILIKWRINFNESIPRF